MPVHFFRVLGHRLYEAKKVAWGPIYVPFGSDSLLTVISELSPSPFERASYYNGVTGDDDHPLLLYRSDYGTTPFNKPTGRFTSLPVKSIHGVFDTPLNRDNVWIPLGLQIVQIIKARKVNLTSVDPARFYTHPADEAGKGSLGPVVIWVGVKPGTTSSETAHEVSLEILGLLKDEGIEGVVIESDATQHVRRFLTPLHGVSLAAEDTEREDAQGMLTLWFHENRDKDGNRSNKVFGVTSCHVLRRNPTVDYEHRGGAPMCFVRICGGRRFDRGLDETTDEIANRAMAADVLTREIAALQSPEPTEEDVKEIEVKQWYLDRETKAVNDLPDFHLNATRNWSHISRHRNIGYTQYAPAITVDEGGRNVVFLGTKYALQQLNKMSYPIGGGPTTFKFPEEGKLQVEGWSTLDELAVPEDIDSEHQRFVMVAKDGNTTDLTVGRYAGLVSFTENDVGVTSIEIGVYNSGRKTAEVLSGKGDSGALVWHMKNDKAFIVGQFHSGQNKGGSTANHATYCTPGEKLLANIKAKFPHADFFRTSW
ncbi:hypothetical protein BOTBODRAFT_146737 [Botryobasidium botryosum FD-172 SS1]|uniref:Uncharacterized protein n=1 Tax=Botryobasidium botryosum (strain FD-172 SS1) TaxID=930990 RepID=A0A067MK46_BOTB1|nr:hypothetical protein BOTBODRAFT_146737 [Botryobasidium botryosum FD-172 SS1]